MAINLENELKTISLRLKALSKKVDTIAGGMGKSKIAKRNSGSKRDTRKVKKPTSQIALEIKGDVSSVPVHETEDVGAVI